MTVDELKPIVEAIMFVTADEPMTLKQLCGIFEGEAEDDVRGALEALEAEYERRGGGFELRRVAGGFRFATRPEHSEYIRRFRKQQPMALAWSPPNGRWKDWSPSSASPKT